MFSAYISMLYLLGARISLLCGIPEMEMHGETSKKKCILPIFLPLSTFLTVGFFRAPNEFEVFDIFFPTYQLANRRKRRNICRKRVFPSPYQVEATLPMTRGCSGIA